MRKQKREPEPPKPMCGFSCHWGWLNGYGWVMRASPRCTVHA